MMANADFNQMRKTIIEVNSRIESKNHWIRCIKMRFSYKKCGEKNLWYEIFSKFSQNRDGIVQIW